MAKVTSKLQVTVPKSLAQRYGIVPGDDIRFEAAGETIRVVPPAAEPAGKDLDVAARLRLFDVATERQRVRQSMRQKARATSRGWTREELYDRGRPHAD